MARIVMERSFDPATGEADFERSVGMLEGCLEARDVRPIRSTIAADFSRSVCEFEAKDADTLRNALRRAGIAFERVWTANVIDW